MTTTQAEKNFVHFGGPDLLGFHFFVTVGRIH